MAAKSTPKQRRPNDRTCGEYDILIGRMSAEVIAQKIEKITADPAQNPGDWLYQLGVVLRKLADEVGAITSFRAERKHVNAKRLDAGEPPDPQDLADLRRVKLKTLHGKTGEERQMILDRWKKFESMQMTGPEYLRATCEVMLESWPVAIYGARRLLRKIHDEGATVSNEPAFTLAREPIQEALACLVTIADQGLSIVADWKRACRVTEFDDDDAVAELFLHGGAFAEHLREHRIQRRLEAVADRIHACSLAADSLPKDPALWLRQLADRIEDLAHDAGKIAWFESRNVHTIAKAVAARDPQESFAASPLMRLAKREMHGEPPTKQREIEKSYRTLWERPPLDADGYLDGVCEEFFTHWTPAIERAQALAGEIAEQIEAGRAPLDVLRDALAAVSPVARDGQAFLDDCRKTLEIDEFTPDETRAELFGHADLSAERLRKSDTEARLRQVADTLRAYAVQTEKPIPASELISSAVAVAKYHVSKATLQRAVKKGWLHDHRTKGHTKTAPLILSETEVAARWPANRQ